MFATEGELTEPPAQSEQTTPPETPETPPIESETPETPEQSAYEQVVALFTALPNALVITTETTEEEKDVIIAQLTEAMDAFDALTQEEQDKFLAEQEVLYKAVMALNDAITGAKAVTLGEVTVGNETELQAAITNITAPTTIALSNNIIATSSIKTKTRDSNDITIDLKGFKLSSTGDFYIIDHQSFSKLTITDTVGGGTISSTAKVTLMNNSSGGTINISGGTLSCNSNNTIWNSQPTPINITPSEGQTVIIWTGSGSHGAMGGGNIVLSLGEGVSGKAGTNYDGSNLVAYNAADIASYKYLKFTAEPPAAVISFDARTGDTIPSATAGEEGTIAMPANPTWTGYDFGGWYTGIDGAGDVVTADTTHTASATVYAKWTKGGNTVRTEKLWVNTASPAPDQGWTWDAEKSTLTLNGFTLDATYISHSGVKDEISLPSNSTLEVIGTNIVIASDIKTGSTFTDAINGSGSLVINGTGTLNASAKTYAITAPRGDITISEATINAESTREDMGFAISTDEKIIINGSATVSVKSNNVAFDGKKGIFAEGATVTGTDGEFVSGTTKELKPSDPATPVVISFGPSIKVDTQSGTATYGTAASPTFAVTASSFGNKYPAFAPNIVWTSGTAPTGVTTAFSDSNAKLTFTTTAATPAGEYKFKVVSAKADTGNYESAEATLKEDKLTATITWGSTVSFPYNGSAQAPTATVSNKVGSDDVTVTVTGAKTDAGAKYTATADSLAGTAAVNYAMPSTKPTIGFAITAIPYAGEQAAAPDASKATITDNSVTLAVQTIADPNEIVHYGRTTTGKDPTAWGDSPKFTNLTPNTDYYFFARVKPNINHGAGLASAGTKIRTGKSDADKLVDANAAVTAALNGFTATNATDAAAMLALANKALADAGITGITVEWDTSGAFSKTDATEEDSGSVAGTIKITCNAENDTVAFNKTIAKLPSDPTEKINLVKKAIETALSNYKATNATIADDIKAIVDKANTDTGVIGVTVDWQTPSDFNKQISTDSANGKVTGTLTLTSGSAADTISINCPIERSDKQKLAGAIIDANTAMTGITINNGSPSSVAKDKKFVSDAEMKALTDAIAAAELVDPNTATSADLITATTALNDAIATFKTAIKTGTYTSGGGTPPSPPSYGGGGSGGDSTPPAVEPPTTTQNPPTTVETNIPATVDKNGNATVNVTDKIMQDAIGKAVAEANKNGTIANGVSIVINVTTGGKDANTVTVNLPKTVQETVIAGQVVNTIVVVDRPDIAINMNLASIKEINKQAQADVQLSATRLDNSKLSAQAQAAIGNRPTFDLKASYESGTKAVSNFGTGSVTVEIPYTMQKGEVVGNLYAVYVDENGKVSYITNSSYDANAKVLRFATNHFSVYGIGSKAPTRFTDIADHWAKDDIEFAANRGLLSGTSNTAFSPNSAMTRGMFAKALTTLSGKDMTAVVGGNMADMVTREGMAVIMQNYAKAISYTLPSVHAENTFADSAKISTSANDSVKKLQMAGVISGKSGNVFDPQGTATRAEVSAVLRRFIELAISTDTAQGWMMNDSGKWMYYENGKAVKSETKSIDGKSYTFNGYGETVDVPKNLNYGSYVVKKGESWWKIAHDQKCNMLELAKLNGKTIFSMIHPGDTLKIPQK